MNRDAFLREYRDASIGGPREERILAVGRAFLTVTGLLAIYLDPAEPGRLAALTYSVLLAYAIYSVGLLVIVPRMRVTRTHSLLIHALDILWCSVLTVVSEGPISPFFLFFLFGVVSAAYRWGFRETVGTAALCTVIFLGENALAVVGSLMPQSLLETNDVDLNRSILRVTYLMLTGFLLGYLAEQEKQLRAESAAAAAAREQPRVDLGFSGSAAAVATTLLRMFGATSIALVLREYESERTRLWRIDSTGIVTAGRDHAEAAELSADEELDWLFKDVAVAWDAEYRREREPPFVRVTQPELWPLQTASMNIPARIRGTSRCITALNMGLPGEWHGRAYLYDMPRSGTLERRLHVLESIASHVMPALTNVFLLQRLHSEAGAAERARVARELHDGAIQALVGLQMNIQAMRRVPPRAADMDAELSQIEEMLQREVVSLRHVMHALRPMELDAGESLDAVLAGIVEGFRRDSGIAARFIGADGIRLKPAAALELVRITQEALMNVRRHSGARNVLVRLVRDHGHFELSIEDDGHGFAFAGVFTGNELDQRRLGPAVIKERARMLGADLLIESVPGDGARVELRFEAEGVGASK